VQVPKECDVRSDDLSMKTIGILGGMSAASTQIYYRVLCQLTRERLGGLHSPSLLIRSLDFAIVEALQTADRWDEAGLLLNVEAKALERGGADMIVLATNTMHRVAETMMDQVQVPLVHIATATAQSVRNRGLRRPGLMATRFTMDKQGFYVSKMAEEGLDVLVPEELDQADTHRIIYDELCCDIIKPQSRQRYEDIARRLIDRGADSLILGCTEVGMLLNQQNVDVPVFDSTLVHCETALELALSEE
jgi:aspartate racemase